MFFEVCWMWFGGGMFVWFELLGEFDVFELFECSLEEDCVVFILGGVFVLDLISGVGCYCVCFSFVIFEFKNI